MESWVDPTDRPDLLRRQEPKSNAWIWFVLMGLVLAVGAGGIYLLQREEAPPLADAAPVASAPLAAPAPQSAAEPPVSHRLDEAPVEPGLPTLDNSDAMARDALVGLLGRKSFDELVYPSGLIRRIVATVDNLPRQTAPTRVMPIQPVPGALAVIPEGEQFAVAAANAARYAPYVRVFDSIDAKALVRRYVASYPLFQRAYEELGFPGQYFNDRLMQAIDNLLAAPELSGPVALVRPKILYQFADEDLESRSAGQKIMMRMGPDNAAKVKAKLREIRRELIAAARANRQ